MELPVPLLMDVLELKSKQVKNLKGNNNGGI
jgi:hypothetical protein